MDKDYLKENVKRLRDIQAKCKVQEKFKRNQPLKATRDYYESDYSPIAIVSNF